MLCTPADSVPTLSWAIEPLPPLDGVTVAVPRLVDPSINVTVPVGAPLVAGVTVAVSTTVPPKVEFAGAAPTVVVVPAWVTFTFTGIAVESDAPKLVPPPYDATMALFPTGSVVVANVATPDAFKVAVPITVVPLENVTVPVGTAVPDAGCTVATNDMLAP